MNANTLVVTRPGATSGSKTRKNTRKGPAPSMAAASSSSRGTAATKLRSSQIRYVARNRNRNLATAMAASSASAEETTTDESVTTRLLRRNVQYGMPITEPLITLAKFDHVGCAGSGCGVSE